MISNDEDVKYREIIRTLNSLQKVTAPAGFETNLMRRINAGNYIKKKTFRESILSPSRLIPSSAIAAAMVIILLLFNLNNEDTENPLTIDPRVREDFIVIGNEVPDNEQTPQEAPANTEEAISDEGLGDTSSDLFTSRLTASASNPDLFINKSGLNFRQIHLTNDEKEQLQKLKDRIKAIWRKSDGN
jgi:hypothetical protein